MMRGKKILSFLLAAAMCLGMTGCGTDNNHGLDAKEPQNITVWNYYSGALAEQFDGMVAEFNNSVGKEKGIVVTSESKSSIDDLNQAVQDAADKIVGAEKMPDVFQCYLDTAVSLEEKNILVNLDDYIGQKEKEEYVQSYIDEGTFGKDNEWKLFPVAKSTEVLMLNKTDWDKFADETGVTTDDLTTWEGVAEVAEKYYDWSDGLAFFGRDAFANYMIIGSKQLGSELFEVKDGEVTLHYDEKVMRTLWDNYYVPYVKGFYTQKGRYRSDDIKLGAIIAQVCSTSSAVYFPTEVCKEDGTTYPIDYLVLPLPDFKGTEGYAVQQGASMAVTKSNEQKEYASVVFLQWFTQKEQNLQYSLGSGYLPVKKEACDLKAVDQYLKDHQDELKSVEKDTIQVAIKQQDEKTLFTSKGFEGGTDARTVMNSTMLDQAVADRTEIDNRVAAGEDRETVLKDYLSDEHFQQWFDATKQKLEEVCK